MEKILVIQTAFPGDAILTLPLVQELKSIYPSAQIDIVAIPSTKEIFEASASVNKVFVMDKRGKHKNLFSLIRFAQKLKTENYNRLFSPHRSLRSTLFGWLVNSKNSISFDNSALSWIYSKTVKYRKTQHEVQRNLALAGEESVKNFPEIIPEIVTDEAGKQRIKQIISENNLKEFIIIAPGSIWFTKVYPREYFHNLINYLTQKKITIVLIGSGLEYNLCDSLSSGNSTVLNFAGKLSIPESVELMRSASLVVCNDSAPTHMATAAKTKVLTIYCSTVKDFGFYPYSSGSDYISYDELDCKPCGIHGFRKCPLKTFDCGYKLLPQKVIERVEEMLAY